MFIFLGKLRCVTNRYLLNTTFLPNFFIKKLRDTDVGIQLNPIITVSRKTRLSIEALHGSGKNTSRVSCFPLETEQTLAVLLG